MVLVCSQNVRKEVDCWGWNVLMYFQLMTCLRKVVGYSGVTYLISLHFHWRMMVGYSFLIRFSEFLGVTVELQSVFVLLLGYCVLD